MIIAPLPALDPYNADAAPLFRTDILSMSSGLISPNPLPISVPGFQKSLFTLPFPPLAPKKLFIGTPSTIIKGWLSPVKELLPRRVIFVEDAGPLEPLITCKPETLPTRAFATLVSFASVSCSDLTSWNEYPRDLRSLLIPIAVTTTSSMLLASSCKLIFNEVEETVASLVRYPMLEKRIFWPLLASMEKLPSLFV